jgi:hypothetical protein
MKNGILLNTNVIDLESIHKLNDDIFRYNHYMNKPNTYKYETIIKKKPEITSKITSSGNTLEMCDKCYGFYVEIHMARHKSNCNGLLNNCKYDENSIKKFACAELLSNMDEIEHDALNMKRGVSQTSIKIKKRVRFIKYSTCEICNCYYDIRYIRRHKNRCHNLQKI